MSANQTTEVLDYVAWLGVPLMVITVASFIQGLPVGNASTVVAAVVASILVTVIRHFGASTVKTATGGTEDALFHFVFMSINTVVTVLVAYLML